VTRNWQGYSVLIVEDCADYQTLLLKMVTGFGFSASVCDGGREALERLASNPVDLVISDVQMPNGSGLWLLRQMRDSGDQTPIILVSAGAGITGPDPLLLEANGFLRKPLAAKELKSIIKKVMADM
jgi:CheY-like chemotaxis protein